MYLIATRYTFSLEDMRRFAVEAWGELGDNVVKQWARFNEIFFEGGLRPIPLVITQTQPFGKNIGKCGQGGTWRQGRLIQLNLPLAAGRLVADNCTLLHEVVHQNLQQNMVGSGHQADCWRQEIMRLHNTLTGKEILAGRYATRRIDGKVTRFNRPHPETNMPSLTQMQIARWPHDQGIQLGELGRAK
jgi:hypothetical protein